MTTDMDISLFWDDSPDLWDTVFLDGRALPGVARVSASHGRKLDVKSAPGANGARIVDKGYEPAKVEITLKLWSSEQFREWMLLAPTLTFRREPPARRASAAPTRTAGTKQSKNPALERQAERELRRVQRDTETLTRYSDELTRRGTARDQQDPLLDRRWNELQQRRSGRARSLERHDFEITHPALDTIQVHRVYIEEVSTPKPAGAGIYEVTIKAVESKEPRSTASRTVQQGAVSAADVPIAFGATAPSQSGGAAP